MKTNSHFKEGPLSFASASRKLIFFFSVFLLCLTSKVQGTANCQTSQFKPSCWTASADFLVWYASEEVASIWADVITVGDNTSAWEARGFDFNWDYGLRLGLTSNLDCDQWDTAFYWTWFHTSERHTIPFDSETRISPEFFAAFLSGNIPESMSVKWSLSFNMYDWELGKNCFVCRNVSLRPFIGLKGGWINQSIDAHYNNLIITEPTDLTAQEHLANNFWGIGPSVGAHLKWEVYNCFHLVGDFSMASLWGVWNCQDFYENSASQTSSVTTDQSMLGSLMFRGFLGLAWDVGLGCENSQLEVKLGFETQIWINQLRIATFQLQRLHHDLTLQGMTLSCGYGF